MSDLKNKKILLASDHAGFEMKNKFFAFLKENGFEVEDMGPFEYDEKDDYPDYVKPLAEKISENSEEYVGIIYLWDALASDRARVRVSF